MTRTSDRGACAVVILVAAFSSGSAFGQVVESKLGEADATFPEAFSLIRGLRELPDGRVMVADALGQVLVIADMEAGVADTLGGVGQGPGEYRQPDGLFALRGDSTLLVDLGNARLTVIGPDGSFGETMPLTQGEPGPGGRFLIILPRGVDLEGGLYFQSFGGGTRGQVPDSAAVMRYDRGDGAIDTVAMIKLPDLVRSSSGGAGNRSVAIRQIPLSPRDAWAVAGDGRIAVARAVDYHLEWIGRDGRVVRGPANEYAPVKIGRAEKEEWIELSQIGGLRIAMSIDNGERRLSLSRGGGSRGDPDVDSYDWPKAKPAFEADGVWVTPESDVWVQRQVAAGEGALIDVFGGDAALKARVRLPVGRRIVSIGSGTLYLARIDEFGLQHLERYRKST